MGWGEERMSTQDKTAARGRPGEAQAALGPCREVSPPR